jgi:hypothetical protein
MTLRSDQEDTTAQELSETFDTAAFKQAQRGGWKFRPQQADRCGERSYSHGGPPPREGLLPSVAPGGLLSRVMSTHGSRAARAAVSSPNMEECDADDATGGCRSRRRAALRSGGRSAFISANTIDEHAT